MKKKLFFFSQYQNYLNSYEPIKKGFSKLFLNLYDSHAKSCMCTKLFLSSNLAAYYHISVGNTSVGIWIFNQQIYSDSLIFIRMQFKPVLLFKKAVITIPLEMLNVFIILKETGTKD